MTAARRASAAAHPALHHVRDGRGPALVLLSGIGMDGSAWAPVVDLLTPERDVWRVDMPGFGGSPAIVDGPCGIEQLADAVAAFLDASGPERPHVAGNSLGGVVALELARRGLVASATALSPVGFANPAEGGFAWLSLRATYAIAARIHGRAPELLRRPRMRRLLYGQLYAHAERLTPGTAYSHMCVMLEGTGFHPVLEAMGGYRFQRPAARAGDDRLGHPRRAAAADGGAPRPPRAARGPPPVAARVRPRSDERRSRAGRAGAARGQQPRR